MLKKAWLSIQFVIVVCLVIVFALSAVWAAVKTYDYSVVVKHGRGGAMGNREIRASIPKGALDTYLEEQERDQVEIWTDVTEELVKRDGHTYYRLTFVFGPSGAYFDPPLQLKLGKKYARRAGEVWLFDENGEAVEGVRRDRLNSVIFEIPHFSEYSYDDYDYY